MLRRIALSALVNTLNRSYTSNVTVHLRALELKEANTPKRSGRQEIVKLRIEITRIEREQYKKSTKPKAGSLRESTR